MTTFMRRGFLQTSAALALMVNGLEAPPSLAATPSSKRKFTMELSCGMIGVSASLSEAIQLAHQYGFESVTPSVDTLARLSDAALQEVLADLKAKRLTWGAVGLPVEFRDDEAAFTRGLKGLPAWAKAARRAGVVRVATWLNPCHSSLPYIANFRRHARRLRDIAQVLANQEMRLGLEYVGPKTSWTSARYPFIHTMAEMKELIAEIGQKNVGFLLDSWHWYTAGDREADLLTLRNQDVISCHLNDAPANLSRDRQMDNVRELPCATGVIDVKTFLGALVKIGYDGPVCAEPFDQRLRALPADKAVAAAAAAMKKAFALVN